MLLPGPTNAPESALDRTSDGFASDVSLMLHAPRPWVPAASVRCVVSRLIWSIATIGKPVPSPNHDFPPSRVTKGPTSVPAYKVSGYDGSSTSELTGTSGRLAVMFPQCWPPSVVLNTCPALAGVAALKPL